MRKTKLKYRLWCLFLLPIITGSCEKIIDVGTPTDMLVTESVFRSNESAVSAMSGVYVSMMSQSLRLPFTISDITGMYGDELTYNGSAAATLNTYRNQLVSKDAQTNPIWTNGYKYIYQVNSIINGLEKSSKVMEPVKGQLMGESYFLRAFWHFYLLNLYGEIPLVTSIDYSINGSLSRQTEKTVYEGVVGDLLKAKALLGNKYVGANSIIESNERLRPNKFVASALLAKVYLFGKEWGKAEVEASMIISNPIYQIEDVNLAFKANSKEAIWQLAMPTPAAFGTYEAFSFTVTSFTNSKTLSEKLVASFPEQDLRINYWTGTINDNLGNQHRYPAKYKNRTSTIDEHSIVFRLADLYLVRAEAKVQQNKILPAIDDTNKVRLRAGLLPLEELNPGIGKNALLDSVYLERKREMFCEWGNRWMDMKRTGTASSIMTVVTPEKGGTWSDNWLVWPLPLADIDNNRKLVQNNGYE